MRKPKVKRPGKQRKQKKQQKQSYSKHVSLLAPARPIVTPATLPEPVSAPAPAPSLAPASTPPPGPIVPSTPASDPALPLASLPETSDLSPPEDAPVQQVPLPARAEPVEAAVTTPRTNAPARKQKRWREQAAMDETCTVSALMSSSLSRSKQPYSADEIHQIALLALADSDAEDEALVEQDWILPRLIPVGDLMTIGGDVESGKTVLTRQLITCVSNGTPWLDGTPVQQGNVLVITPDTDRNVVRRQLKVQGAALKRVSIVTEVSTRNTTGAIDAASTQSLRLPRDFDLLSELIVSSKARLVVIDPFIQLIDSSAPGRRPSMESMLERLRSIARHTHTAIVLTTHCGLRGGNITPRALERSHAFAAYTASQLVLVRHPLKADQRRLIQIRNHYGQPAPSCLLSISAHPDHPDIPVLTIQQETITPDISGRDIMQQTPAMIHARLIAPDLLSVITSANGTPLSHKSLCQAVPGNTSARVHLALRLLVVAGHILHLGDRCYILNEGNAPIDPVIDLQSYWSDGARGKKKPEMIREEKAS